MVPRPPPWFRDLPLQWDRRETSAILALFRAAYKRTDDLLELAQNSGLDIGGLHQGAKPKHLVKEILEKARRAERLEHLLVEVLKDPEVMALHRGIRDNLQGWKPELVALQEMLLDESNAASFELDDESQPAAAATLPSGHARSDRSASEALPGDVTPADAPVDLTTPQSSNEQHRDDGVVAPAPKVAAPEPRPPLPLDCQYAVVSEWLGSQIWAPGRWLIATSERRQDWWRALLLMFFCLGTLAVLWSFLVNAACIGVTIEAHGKRNWLLYGYVAELAHAGWAVTGSVVSMFMLGTYLKRASMYLREAEKSRQLFIDDSDGTHYPVLTWYAARNRRVFRVLTPILAVGSVLIVGCAERASWNARSFGWVQAPVAPELEGKRLDETQVGPLPIEKELCPDNRADCIIVSVRGGPRSATARSWFVAFALVALGLQVIFVFIGCYTASKVMFFIWVHVRAARAMRSPLRRQALKLGLKFDDPQGRLGLSRLDEPLRCALNLALMASAYFCLVSLSNNEKGTRFVLVGLGTQMAYFSHIVGFLIIVSLWVTSFVVPLWYLDHICYDAVADKRASLSNEREVATLGRQRARPPTALLGSLAFVLCIAIPIGLWIGSTWGPIEYVRGVATRSIPRAVCEVTGNVPGAPGEPRPPVRSAPLLQTRSIAIILIDNETHIPLVGQSFATRLKERMGQHHRIRTFVGSPDATPAGDALNKRALDDALKWTAQPDLIVTVGTRASTYVDSQTPFLPHFFIAVTDPIASGLAPQDHKDARNVSGFSNGIRREDMLQWLSRCFRDKRLGFLYSSSQPPDMQMLDFFKHQQAVNILPIQADESTFVLPRDLPRDADVVFGWYYLNRHIDDFVESNPNIAFVGPNESNIAAGAVASYGADFHKLGKDAADVVVERYFSEGVPLGKIAIQYPDEARAWISRGGMQRYNLEMHEDCKAEPVP